MSWNFALCVLLYRQDTITRVLEKRAQISSFRIPFYPFGMTECYRCIRRFRFEGTAPMAVRGEKQSGRRKPKSRRSFLPFGGLCRGTLPRCGKAPCFYCRCDITRGLITAVNCRPSRERATELDWKHPAVKNASVQRKILFRRTVERRKTVTVVVSCL